MQSVLKISLTVTSFTPLQEQSKRLIYLIAGVYGKFLCNNHSHYASFVIQCSLYT